jgi:hypothetical protein
MAKEDRSVAIVGAGPSGLAAARYLVAQGFEPELFESHTDLGGQWAADNPNSGIWPAMRTNTAKFVTKLSDFDFPDEVALFPHNAQVLDHLKRYAAQHGLVQRCRFQAQVVRLAPAPDGPEHGYLLEWQDAGGRHHSKRFARAVIACGRYNVPAAPDIPGLSGFAGTGGVHHSFDYPGPEAFRDRRVVVAGGNISALEIASDVAMAGAASVHLAQRRQRWVMPKVAAGVPIEYLGLTRGGALALERENRDTIQAWRLDFVRRYCGDPAGYGAPAPDPDIERAGVTGCPYFLNLVAEDRIAVRGFIGTIDGHTVGFQDSSTTQADALILATGFGLDLPFLDPGIARHLDPGPDGLALANYTFHPELPGLAVLGLFKQAGPYPVVLEQQARYLAYTWGSTVAPPTTAALQAAMGRCDATDLPGGIHQQHEMAIRFARLAGVDPGGIDDPELQALLEASAVTGESFRLTGPDARPDAAEIVRRDAARWAPRARAAA